ncbi:hypothetical protein RHSIM_Rhsim06G0069600 [Rhododendron simsii]|uniref:Uncharacterized protein n=1 Tax=Rhododendron simsii TaxID=118357 RepID=A0A834LLU0_RHOSS|nr:hypothetical protein RHSIM_Rhsim06G0069600 [Rhododendron simsii]
MGLVSSLSISSMKGVFLVTPCLENDILCFVAVAGEAEDGLVHASPLQSLNCLREENFYFLHLSPLFRRPGGMCKMLCSKGSAVVALALLPPFARTIKCKRYTLSLIQLQSVIPMDTCKKFKCLISASFKSVLFDHFELRNVAILRAVVMAYTMAMRKQSMVAWGGFLQSSYVVKSCWLIVRLEYTKLFGGLFGTLDMESTIVIKVARILLFIFFFYHMFTHFISCGALEHPNKPAEAAVAETTAKALVSVDHLSAGKAA